MHIYIFRCIHIYYRNIYSKTIFLQQTKQDLPDSRGICANKYRTRRRIQETIKHIWWHFFAKTLFAKKYFCLKFRSYRDDCMDWAGSFVARYDFLYRFKTNMAMNSKLCWNCFTITWAKLKASRLVFEKRHSLVDRASSSHVIIQPSLPMC